MVFLVKRAQKGDKEAFIQLMERNKESMYRIARSFLRNEQDIADALQDTILSAYEHIGELEKTSYFKTWLIRILMNKCKSILRTQKCVSPVAEVPERAEAFQSDLEFWEMLHALPGDSRMIFLLYYGECLTTREISQILEINENTVRGRLRRGRSILKEWVTINS
ncbi:RNA polymerase sigma factor [Roseburia hominis]